LRYLWIASIGSVGLGAVTFAIQCSPSEDTSVNITTACDPNALNLGDTAEATVKAYLDTGNDLQARSKDIVDRFIKVCNAVNTDLGDPTGNDIHAACNNIATRITNAINIAPTPDGGTRANWVIITLPITTCVADAKAQASCLDSCSSTKGCDPLGTCGEGGIVGKCGATCNGLCRTEGDTNPCVGGCDGVCASPNPDGGPEGGVPGCVGECQGTCTAATWLGRCSTGCDKSFIGRCDGTCKGSCDGVPYPSVPPEAGVDPDAGDAGDGGDGEAGPSDASADAAPPPPGSGNCPGTCTGSCVGQASGSCGAKCTGNFAGGSCTAVGACIGACSGLNLPCVTECNGICSTRSTTCTGQCDDCSARPDSPNCTAGFTCGQPNQICNDVCAMRGALAVKCTSAPMDIRLAGDYKLYDALRAHADELSAVIRDANLINQKLAGVLGKTSGKFHEIGVVHDNARLCADKGGPLYDQAALQINDAIGASGVITGAKF